MALLARAREREANVRRDHAHKTARSLIERYDTICVEDLNDRRSRQRHARAGLQRPGLGRVHPVCCTRKRKKLLVQIVQVDARNTVGLLGVRAARSESARRARVRLLLRLPLDSDVNAARNILARGLAPFETGPGWGRRRPPAGRRSRAVA